MSLDDSQEEDCTVYIEELKSDNANLKLNAASKISVIASVLGHNRIRDELIPYIIEIIEQMDNDNDFLIKVCEGLLELKSFCENNKEVSILIHPLKILASLDQPSVRDKAINCLKKLAEQQDKSFYEDYYFPLVVKLS
jgi:serine/threonine-protein phosphatase 2A regulatory subunit A